MERPTQRATGRAARPGHEMCWPCMRRGAAICCKGSCCLRIIPILRRFLQGPRPTHERPETAQCTARAPPRRRDGSRGDAGAVETARSTALDLTGLWPDSLATAAPVDAAAPARLAARGRGLVRVARGFSQALYDVDPCLPTADVLVNSGTSQGGGVFQPAPTVT